MKTSGNSRFACVVGAAVLTVALLGCQSLSDGVGHTVQADVYVPEANGSDNVTYKILASTNKDCEEAVKEFRNENWARSIELLQLAVQKDRMDARAHFALGLAHEMSGQLDLALEHFMIANRIPRKINSEYDASVRRVKAKLGR